MDSLSAEFAKQAYDKVLEFGEVIQLVQLFLLGVAGPYTALLTKNRIEKGRLEGHNAIVGETLYAPSGEINRTTGEEYIDQRLRTYKSSLDLQQVFHPSVSKRLMKFLDKAAKLCTDERPIVFDHLKDVIPVREFPRAYEMITRQWKNYFSEYLNDAAHPQSLFLDRREAYEENTKIPFLVYEQSSTYKQYRVLLVPISVMETQALPRMENMRVEQGNEMVHDPAHYLNDRLKTNLAIREELRNNFETWVDGFGVQVMTGKTKNIPVPARP